MPCDETCSACGNGMDEQLKTCGRCGEDTILVHACANCNTRFTGECTGACG